MNEEMLRSKILENLERMSNKVFESCRIDEQCRRRFKVGWNEFRLHLVNVVINFELTPGRLMNPKEFLVCIGGTNDWMTGGFLGVIRLSFRGYDLAGTLKRLSEAESEPAESRAYTNFCRDIMDIAPILCPKETIELLKEHGLVYRAPETKEQIGMAEAFKPKGRPRVIEDFPEIDLQELIKKVKGK